MTEKTKKTEEPSKTKNNPVANMRSALKSDVHDSDKRELNHDKIGTEVPDTGGTYISIKQQMQTEEKQVLAKFIVNKYIKDLHSVAIDAGSTCQQVIEQMMLNRKFLSILTNNMTAFRQNSKQNVEYSANEFILTGGKYVALFDALLGNETINSYQLFHPHIVIIGVSGYIPKRGFFCHGNDEKAVKELLFNKKNLSKVIIPVDYSKIGRSDSYLFGKSSEINEEDFPNCEVVLMPPIKPFKPDRTSDTEIDKLNLNDWNISISEYENNIKDFKEKVAKLKDEAKNICITQIDVKEYIQN